MYLFMIKTLNNIIIKFKIIYINILSYENIKNEIKQVIIADASTFLKIFTKVIINRAKNKSKTNNFKKYDIPRPIKLQKKILVKPTYVKSIITIINVNAMIFSTIHFFKLHRKNINGSDERSS